MIGGHLRRGNIRRFLLAPAALLAALSIAPLPTSAAFSLALSRHDYPSGFAVTPLPATNAVADTYFGPVHRTSFSRLGRIDGEGWIQAGLWHFRTGRGAAVRSHRTVFAYGVHVFKGARGSQRALNDLKLRTRLYRVAHLWTRRYAVSDAHGTLVFDFFRIGPVEVEAYFEYTGVAPLQLQDRLRHAFSTQSSHLVALTRRYSTALRQHPATPTESPVPTDTSTATEVATSTSTPTATPQPTNSSTPRPTPRPTNTPTATATPTPAGLVISAAPTAPSFAVGQLATVSVHVTFDGSDVPDARVSVTMLFPGNNGSCVGHTDATGTASCSVAVPEEPSGTRIPVQVEATTPQGDSALTSTSFTIK